MGICNSSILQQLFTLANSSRAASGADYNDAFEPIGLTLLVPPRNYDYWCTPINSLTFATTGWDGVHFGLLSTTGSFDDFSPVVMTVPMGDTPNTILAANLKEFLALGCRFGYIGIEQLVSDKEATIRELAIARFHPETSQSEREILRRISSTFNVAPWPSARRRLEELSTMFASAVQLPSQAAGAA